jgi:PPK2 family polyphosphate:nucleotide phosphotransferase
MKTNRYRVHPGQDVDLSKYDPDDTGPFHHKRNVTGMLERGIQRLAELQGRLYAQDRWSLLLILQARDAAGKDSVIKHVMSGLNPQGTQVSAFKRPSEEELDHDYLWRSTKALPERGRIGIFNRSYYEEVLVVRVHPDVFAREKVPAELITRHVWKERFEDINAFERYLTRNGTIVRKFFLHVSKEEQKRRFLERLDDPAKNWKWESGDLPERALWGDYTHAYEQMLSHTSTKNAPWFVVPADHKWFTRLLIAQLVIEALEGLDLKFPRVSKERLAELKQARTRLGDES